MSKKNRIMISISVIALLLIVAGISYAYFSAQIIGSESSTTIVLDTGTLSIVYDGGSSISASNIIPSSDAVATKTFTVTGTNTTSSSMNYNLGLVIDSNTFSSGALTYTLTSTNTSSNGSIVPSISGQTAIANDLNYISLGSGSFVNGTNSVHTYVLNIYFLSTESDQNADQGKTFNAHIQINGGSIETNAPEGWNTSISGTLLYALKENSKLSTSTLTTPGRAVTTSDEIELSSTTDDYGYSYYYRGAVANNYVVFANMCWRIVRVTGNGAIKLVLSNYNADSVTNPCDSAYNSSTAAFARYSTDTYTSMYNNGSVGYYNAYIGFMYGTPNSATYALEHANTNKSVILTNLETWYNTYLSTYSSYLADTIWCNDKSLSSGTGIGGTETQYGASARLSSVSTASPSLVCPNDADGGSLSKFTVSDTTNGNGDLTYPIGLLTADEVAFAGGAYYINNTTYYLYENTSGGSGWFTMSPALLYGEMVVSPYNGISWNDISYVAELRPSISLISTTEVTGSGTSSNPYVVE